MFYDRVARPASDLAHLSILKDSFTIARRDPSRKTAARLLRPQHPDRGARSDRGAPGARRRSHRAGRAHRGDGSLPRAPGSSRALLPRPHSPHGGHVRPPGARLHLFHLWRLELPERGDGCRSEEHTSELQSHHDLVCRLLLEKKKKKKLSKANREVTIIDQCRCRDRQMDTYSVSNTY